MMVRLPNPRGVRNLETILIIEDDNDIQLILSHILKEEGYHVITVRDGEKALHQVKKHAPDLVISAMKLPGMDGMQVLEEMRKIDKDLSVIMLTAHGDIHGAVKAMKVGAFDSIIKPFDKREMVALIKKALESRYVMREAERLRKGTEEESPSQEVFGESPEIKHILKQVSIVAPTNMTVILQGESGTGKEVMAQMIHHKSLRRDKPFVAIDCGALPETLVESELFGYDRGAFTGANTKKEGKFEQANGGTLFLDEITNLPVVAQGKFLRVTQERRLEHLGGKKEIKVDVRIIVATNTKFSEAVKAGKFREDLFQRLNEFSLSLPSLRARKSDIPILARHFLQVANQELGKRVKGISAEAMNFLLNYPWPGNVRELKNELKRAVLLAETGYIMPAHLSLDMSDPQEESIRPLLSFHVLEGRTSFEDITKKIARDVIKRTLEQVDGNKVKAAAILGMNRKTLYRKLKSLGL